MDQSPSFGQWLKARRKALDLTQWALAAQVGCAEATIQKIEADERRPSRQMAALLAGVLAVPAEGRAAFLEFARGTGAAAPLTPAAPPPRWQTHPPAWPEPAPLTPLIGREALVADLRAALRTASARLVTLTGPPGVGKSRLAAAVAVAAAPDYAAGARIVALAALRDVALVPPAIAAALSVGDTGSVAPLTALQAALRDQELLLVLDNFEQILAAAPTLLALLAACPALRILVTSRAALNIRGEQLWAVPPLSVPDPAELPPLAALPGYAAVALFVERARLLQPGFALSAENAAAIVGICARLDGLPLAIELAAARSKVLPPAAVLARLEHRLALLTGGPRDLPARQQTLRAAIAWSYDLLTPDEQALFRRLSVFVGGWTLPAAEAVCNAVGALATPVFDAMTTLFDHSLVTLASAEAGEPRFTLLETIREYALELLDGSPEAATLHRLHAEYFLALATAAEPELGSRDPATALARLAAERGNFQEVFRWSITAEGAGLALHLAALYWRFCELLGDLSGGRHWLEAVRAAWPGGPTPALGRVLLGTGRIAWLQGDYTEARAYTEQSVAVFRALDDRVNLSRALHSLAVQLGARGERDRARTHYEESLALMRAAGDRAGIARVLNSLGVEARAHGDAARAIVLFEESLALQRELGNTNSIGVLLANLGYAAVEQGDYTRARELFAESLALRRELGHRIGMIDCLAGLAAVAAHRQDLPRAARLFGAAEALAEATAYVLEPDDRAWYAREVAALRAAAGPAGVAAAWAAGRALPLDAVLAYALEAESTPAPAAPC